MLGEFFRAIQAAEAGLERAPEWGECALTLARAQLEFGDLELAVCVLCE